METLSLEQVKAYQGQYKVVPVGVSMYADSCTPIEVLRTVKHISSHCYILEVWKILSAGADTPS